MMGKNKLPPPATVDKGIAGTPPQPPRPEGVAGARREKWQVHKLKPNPLQSTYFRDLSDGELSDLADDIKRRGLRQAIHVLPDGTILAGHQRLRAIKLLGWIEVDVIVRYDLEKAGPAAAEAFFLDDNAVRRQLGPLERLAVLKRRFELVPRGSARRGQGELREEIAAKINITGRHLDRLLKLLSLPPALRHAYDDQRLTLADATQCLALQQGQLSQVVVSLQDGADVSQMIKGLANASKSSRPRRADDLAEIRRQFLRFGKKLTRLVSQDGSKAAALMKWRDERKLREIVEAITQVLVQMESAD